MFPGLRRVSAWLVLAGLSGAAPTLAQASRQAVVVRDSAGLGRALQALLDRLVTEHPNVPGAALHVEAPRLHLSWSGAAGVADRKTGARLTPGTPFRMASNTKTYVAAAILRLWEQGKLRLDDPITRHLPAEYVGALEAGHYQPGRITIRHLLSHSSGIYDWGTDSAYTARVLAEPRHRWSRMEQVRFAMDHGAPYGQPGEVYHYSDTGYILLGEIVERASGLSLARALRSLLHFERLGLQHTWLETLEPVPTGTADRAHQFLGELDTYGFDPSLDLWGGGGLAATAGDMARFTRGLFVGGVYDRRTTLDTMLTKVPARDNKDYHFGIGGRQVDGLAGFGHSGFWNTFSYYFPELDLAVAGSVMQQSEYPLASALLKDTLGVLRPALGR